MANPSSYWMYLRAFTVIRSGERIPGDWFYDAGGGYVSDDVAAALALAAADAAAPRFPRPQHDFVLEMKKMLPPAQGS